MKTNKIVIAATFLFASVSVSFAEETKDYRHFLLTFGVGAGSVDYDVTEYGEKESLTERGLSTDLRIGYRKDPSFEIYYSNKVMFSNMDLAGSSTLAYSGFSGVGASYYFTDPRSLVIKNSFYLTGSFGLSVVWADVDAEDYDEFADDDEVDLGIGLGVSAGLGYRFNRYIMLEASYHNLGGDFSIDDDLEIEANDGLALRFLVNAL